MGTGLEGKINCVILTCGVRSPDAGVDRPDALLAESFNPPFCVAFFAADSIGEAGLTFPTKSSVEALGPLRSEAKSFEGPLPLKADSDLADFWTP